MTDWATFFKDYATAISTGTGLLGIVLGYYFGKWDAERKRKWELEDRDYNKRAAIHDKNIQDARAYVDAYHATVKKIGLLEVSILAVGYSEAINKGYGELIDLYDPAITMEPSFYSLGDAVLNYAREKVHSIIGEELEQASMLRAQQEINKDIEVARIQRFQHDATTFITVLKMRLDQLAQIIPPSPPKSRVKFWRHK